MQTHRHYRRNEQKTNTSITICEVTSATTKQGVEQPGIAVVAAGMLAPVATLILVAVTMLGAVPRLSSYRRGKLIVLVLLGFAVTDFISTMTLSAADAPAHITHSTESPWVLPLTIALLTALAAVFY
ncbi:hypothetical protein CIP107534_00591 [Corynebacterium diphtheriae]|nr:hypothetical protein CIP107521_00762 [Corynebacterium diphtheriae]CAB0550600.1 hypothetical protein CIP107534_00591 [Corynebacterium diphtheriae]